MAPRTKPKSELEIIPNIIVQGAPHIFLKMSENGELPEIKTVGIVRVNPNSRDFVSVVVTSKGDKVLKMEVSEPNLKAIAIDDAKMSFVDKFLGDVE